MTVARPSVGILNFKTIPVDCSKCVYCGELTDIADDAKRALIDSTVFNMIEEERLVVLSRNEEPGLRLQHNPKSELLISQAHNISCDKCGSLLVVPQSFFYMVGTYEDTICHERSRRLQKTSRNL